MSKHKALTGAIAALASVATLGALAAPALAADTTYSPNGKSVAELAQHGGAQRIAAIGNKKAKNVVLFIGDGMGDSEITVARDYLKGANGHFDGLDAVGQPSALGDVQAGTGQYTTFSVGNGSKATAKDPAKDANPTVCTPNAGWLGNQDSSLKDMTKKALDLLGANPNGQKNGFFLQVEGASIDKQDHAGNACGQIGETDDFDQAIAYAMQNVDLTNTLVIVTADHAHTSQILNAQPAYALSTVLKTADGNNMVVSYGTAQDDSRDADGGYNGGDMEHTGTQLRIAASGPGAQRVIGLTDQTDNFYTIAGALGLATSAESQKALSDNGTVKVSAADGKFTADVDGFNGDAVLSYELKDKNDKTVAASDSSTPLSGVRVKTAQTTPIALDGVTEGSEYKLTVTGRQSGKAVTVDFQAPAANSADKNNVKPGAGNADKNGVIASGKVNNDTKAGPFGAALLGKTGTAVLAAAVAIAMLVAVAMLVKTAKAAKNDR